jgi:corrinoid protein of di/trimethylamine methyltransferase
MSVLVEISESLQKGKKKLVVQYVQQALEEGFAPQQILNEGLLPGMDVVGQKFKNNEVFVPEVLVAARAMNAGAEILKPLLAEAGVGTPGKMVLGTVKGDLHDIGKNLVKMMVEGKGIEVIDLGVDVSAEAFVEAAKEHNADIIGCSALLTTTMPVMAEVVKAVEAAGLKDKVKVMIGGAPVTEEFCKSVGADYYTSDAASAAEAAAALFA